MGQRQLLFTSAIVNRPSDENNYQVQVGSFVKGDNFVRFMRDTFARGGSFHTFRLIRPDQSEYTISKRGPHYMGDRLIRDTGALASRLLQRSTREVTKAATAAFPAPR